MDVQYRREPDETCLIFSGEQPADPYVIRVLQENYIQGVLKMRVLPVDDKEEYHFVVTGCQPLSRFWERQQINSSDIYQLLSGLYRIVKTLEDYLIDASHVVLSPEYIFVKKDLSDIRICCHPGFHGDFYAQIRELAQYFLNKIDHLDESSTNKAYEVYRITGDDFFSFEDMLRVVEPEEPSVPEEPEEAWKDETEAEEEFVDVPPEDSSSGNAPFRIQKTDIIAIAAACVGVAFGVYFFSSYGNLGKALLITAASLSILVGVFLGSRFPFKKKSRKSESASENDLESEAVNEDDGTLRADDNSYMPSRRREKEEPPRADDNSNMPSRRREKEELSRADENSDMSSRRRDGDKLWRTNGDASRRKGDYWRADSGYRGDAVRMDGGYRNDAARADSGYRDDAVHMKDSYRNGAVPVDDSFRNNGGQEERPGTGRSVVAEDSSRRMGYACYAEAIDSRVLVSQDLQKYDSINLRRMPFVIGTMEGACDYLLDKPGVSRVHARFEEQFGEYYLTDCNTSNGTYLNGIRIGPNRRYPVREGDEIALADLKYHFR